MCFIFMPLYRFQFNRLSLQKTLACLPFRFLAPFAAQQSPAEHTSYWHREHTSETRLPVLFLHGIGVGLHTYLPFFKEFAASDSQTPADQIGMIAIEIMSINSRMTHAALCKQQQMDEIVAILDKHSWKEFVIVAHSYGTVLATHMLRDSRLHSRVAAMVLADPAAFSSHTPDGTEVFQWMVPKTASQHQLNYFACMDMGVAHTLCRRFLWQENLLWVEDLQHKPVVITLAGKDEVINTRRIAGYLSRSGMDIVQVDEQGLDVFAAALRREQKVIWLPSVNHAEVFDTKRRRGLLLAAMFGYCRR
jgi:pimeloyl-ACP methyl ester carboxylesterase